MSLADYGWSEAWAERFAEVRLEEGVPARVVAEHRELFRIQTGSEELAARIAGRPPNMTCGSGVSAMPR